VNPVRKIEDDTKDKDTRLEMEMAEGQRGIAAETPEEVMEKIHQQATYLGPVMEELLRASQGRGQSHWGLNE
jgi:hypothetical protein